MPEWPSFELAAMLRRLDAAGVEFVVIGGIAAVAHGSPQVTQDLDIVPSPDPSNAGRLTTAFRDLDARPATGEPGMLETTEGQLHVIVKPDGSKGYQQLRAGSIEAIVEGTAVRVAGLDDLIAMKKASGRPKDRLHLEELEAIKRLGGG